ncbi:RNA-directed DNA polymerase, eukaryota, reverse transcriptase zinc-binding domain protein [Tanacetum coccineum]
MVFQVLQKTQKSSVLQTTSTSFASAPVAITSTDVDVTENSRGKTGNEIEITLLHLPMIAAADLGLYKFKYTFLVVKAAGVTSIGVRGKDSVCVVTQKTVPMIDEGAGEVPVAFVIKSKGSNVTDAEINPFISKQVIENKDDKASDPIAFKQFMLEQAIPLIQLNILKYKNVQSNSHRCEFQLHVNCTKERNKANGILTSFWDDDWCGIGPLKILFPRIYLLDLDKGCNVANRLPLSDWSSILGRHPRGGIEMSQFFDMLSTIKDFQTSDQDDTWGLVPGNGLALNKLPSRVNLDRKGIDMDSVLCPICCSDVESVNHVFFTCEMANGLWSLLARWWEVDIPICSNFMDWCSWIDSSHLSAKAKCVLDGVGGSILWAIWRFRNQVIFSATPPLKATLWDFIVSHSFLWISSRNPKFNIRWVDWLKNPLLFIDSM